MTIRILAIETSCDETSAAVVSGLDYPTIETNIIASQIDLHKITGGVVPEVAARAHCEAIIPVIEQALAPLEIKLFGKKSDQTIHNVLPHIDAIAVTVGPGLVGSLLVGIETAKTLAFAMGKPLIGVNHLEGHIFAAQHAAQSQNAKIKNQKYNLKFNNDSQLSQDILFCHSALDAESRYYGSPMSKHTAFDSRMTKKCVSRDYFKIFPALALIVSGGHTELVLIKDMFNYEIIGETLDDAAGEAFDKVASLLGLDYPGGPEIAKQAEEFQKAHSSWLMGHGGKKDRLRAIAQEIIPKLPRPMLHSKDLNFSFSGLKTAVVNLAHRSWLVAHSLRVMGHGGNKDQLRAITQELPVEVKQAIAYEFQEAVVEVLVEKTRQAVQAIGSRVIGSSKILSAKSYQPRAILLTGGVSANKRLREAFQERFGDKLLISPLELTGDNAGMIGLVAWWRLQSAVSSQVMADGNNQLAKSRDLSPTTKFPWQNVDVDPNLEL